MATIDQNGMQLDKYWFCCNIALSNNLQKLVYKSFAEVN